MISWKQDLTEQALAPVPEPVPEPVKWSMTKKFGGQNLNFDRQLLEFGATFFGGLIFVISLAKYPHFNIYRAITYRKYLFSLTFHIKLFLFKNIDT